MIVGKVLYPFAIFFHKFIRMVCRTNYPASFSFQFGDKVLENLCFKLHIFPAGFHVIPAVKYEFLCSMNHFFLYIVCPDVIVTPEKNLSIDIACQCFG